MLPEFTVGEVLAQSCGNAANSANRGEGAAPAVSFFAMIGLCQNGDKSSQVGWLPRACGSAGTEPATLCRSGFRDKSGCEDYNVNGT